MTVAEIVTSAPSPGKPAAATVARSHRNGRYGREVSDVRRLKETDRLVAEPCHQTFLWSARLYNITPPSTEIT